MGKAALILLCLIAGCATPKSAIRDGRVLWCEFSEPRRDATPQTPRWELDEINAHNSRGTKWCGWSP